MMRGIVSAALMLGLFYAALWALCAAVYSAAIIRAWITGRR